MTTISEALQNASAILRDNAIAEPDREARSILAISLNRDPAFLIAHPEYELNADEETTTNEYVSRRAAREPFQHIAGKQEFWGLEFEVNRDVMIPRPETEMIVEEGINILRSVDQPVFCEVGVGSGCIAVSILNDLTSARAIGLDVSKKALAVARRNADKNGVSTRLDLRESDVFGSLDYQAKFDLIVSNPPYVPAEDVVTLQAEVRDFDPLIALTDHADGLSIIKIIVEGAPKYLKGEGFLLMEIGFNQSGKVKNLFDRGVWKELDFLPDLQGIPRMVKARLA